jgi:hypothetical protein
MPRMLRIADPAPYSHPVDPPSGNATRNARGSRPLGLGWKPLQLRTAGGLACTRPIAGSQLAAAAATRAPCLRRLPTRRAARARRSPEGVGDHQQERVQRGLRMSREQDGSGRGTERCRQRDATRRLDRGQRPWDRERDAHQRRVHRVRAHEPAEPVGQRTDESRRSAAAEAAQVDQHAERGENGTERRLDGRGIEGREARIEETEGVELSVQRVGVGGISGEDPPVPAAEPARAAPPPRRSSARTSCRGRNWREPGRRARDRSTGPPRRRRRSRRR